MCTWRCFSCVWCRRENYNFSGTDRKKVSPLWLFRFFSFDELLPSRTSFVLHCRNVHSDREALLQSTKRTPISSRFIDDAVTRSTYIERLKLIQKEVSFGQTHQCMNTKTFCGCFFWKSMSNHRNKMFHNVFHSICRHIHYKRHLRKFSSVLLPAYLLCTLRNTEIARNDKRNFSPFASIQGRVTTSFSQTVTACWCFYSPKHVASLVCQDLEEKFKSSLMISIDKVLRVLFFCHSFSSFRSTTDFSFAHRPKVYLLSSFLMTHNLILKSTSTTTSARSTTSLTSFVLIFIALCCNRISNDFPVAKPRRRHIDECALALFICLLSCRWLFHSLTWWYSNTFQSCWKRVFEFRRYNSNRHSIMTVEKRRINWTTQNVTVPMKTLNNPSIIYMTEETKKGKEQNYWTTKRVRTENYKLFSVMIEILVTLRPNAFHTE